mgnify:CR=1 FL=1
MQGLPVGQFPLVKLVIEKVKHLVREITLEGLSAMLKLCELTVRFVGCVVLEYRIVLPYNRLWLLFRSSGNGRFRCRYNRLFGCRTDLLRLVFMQFFPCLSDTGCGQVAALSKFRCLEFRVAFEKHITTNDIFLVLAQIQVVAFGGKPFSVAIP